MKFKDIMKIFLAVLPICLLARFTQIIFVEESATGFFKPGYDFFGYALTAFFLLGVILLAFVSHIVTEKPIESLNRNVFLSISSFLLGVGIAIEIFSESFVAQIPLWQIAAIDLFGILTVVYLLLFGLRLLFNFPFSNFFAIVPCLYFIMRLICIFTSVSAINLIIDNFLTLMCYCFVLIFFSNYAKLLNNINSTGIHKKLLATGLCGILLCLLDSLPRIILGVLGKGGYVHKSLSFDGTLLLCAIFIFSFLIAYFKKEDSFEN